MKVIDTVRPKSKNGLIEEERVLNGAVARLMCTVVPGVKIKRHSRAYRVTVRVA